MSIYKVDIDLSPELAKRYGVRGTPALVYINKKGIMQKREYGVKSPEHIKENIQKYLK